MKKISLQNLILFGIAVIFFMACVIFYFIYPISIDNSFKCYIKGGKINKENHCLVHIKADEGKQCLHDNDCASNSCASHCQEITEPIEKVGLFEACMPSVCEPDKIIY